MAGVEEAKSEGAHRFDTLRRAKCDGALYRTEEPLDTAVVVGDVSADHVSLRAWGYGCAANADHVFRRIVSHGVVVRSG
jgi:hypothetical protein